MKKYLFIIQLFFALGLSAQETLMFDTSKIDANARLVGRYPHHDNKKKYEYLNFIIEDPALIKKVIADLIPGKEGENIWERPGFTIAIVQDFKEGKTWMVNPSYSSVMYDGHSYRFNIARLKKLAKKYPFVYRYDKVTFNTKDEYEKYISKQKEDKSFLFDYAPSFRYEGSFEIEFPKNQQFSSPKVISEFMSPLIEKIVSQNEYSFFYRLDEKNMNKNDQFTMTFSGPKKVFETIILENLKKGEWKPTIEQGCFFYRTN